MTSKVIAAPLSDSAKSQIDHWIQKFPADQKQSAVLAALHIVQDENKGSLTPELMEAVAEYLGMPSIAVQEVVSFYSLYDAKACGRNKMYVCTNISCLLRGADELMEHIEHKLNIKSGETTPDGKFTLKHFECLGACTKAPMMMMNKQYYENLTPDKIDKILDEAQ
ncbi:MAG: NAD(P)H-dependent oxidoreductase subunit E [Gammaproteobacteria bacterium]|nr:NAD(P)H-dependent oxidoreductase subunit E [Gammaproteobacteria bacterium]